MRIKKVYLWQLILSLVFVSLILVLLSSILVSYFVDRSNRMEQSLETNYNYAKKLASTTDLYLSNLLEWLDYTAEDIKPHLDDYEHLTEEANRFRALTKAFNSVFITDEEGLVIATSPESLDLVGTTLRSEAIKTVIREKEIFISTPYMSSVTNRLIVTISHPIKDEADHLLGIIGGTIYLREGNFLDNMLGDHFYEDGSYVYVVDEDGRIVYHQIQGRVFEDVSANAVVQNLMKGESGQQLVTNTLGKKMLAGYAYIPTAKWGVVSQTPFEIALAPLKNTLLKMILFSLPVFIICIILSWWISRFIARPLHQLANVATHNVFAQNEIPIDKVKVWYYEGVQLKRVIDRSLGNLNERVKLLMLESATDPLTKLFNRRALDIQIQQWEGTANSVCAILLDIDHFKRVNDTYGHPVGDEVLKFLAGHIQDVVQERGLCVRYGREEFCILLPECEHDTYETAEKLRRIIASTVSPTGETITISAGVAVYPDDAEHLADIIHKADQALYEAKNSGRNRTVVYSEQN